MKRKGVFASDDVELWEEKELNRQQISAHFAVEDERGLVYGYTQSKKEADEMCKRLMFTTGKIMSVVRI